MNNNLIYTYHKVSKARREKEFNPYQWRNGDKIYCRRNGVFSKYAWIHAHNGKTAGRIYLKLENGVVLIDSNVEFFGQRPFTKTNYCSAWL